MPKPYIGRFAPSPTGPLHAGSLVAALASYLDARAARGQWRVRIEDIDPPREVPGASALILSQLEHHGLHWDGDICYQSQGQERYLAALETLATKNLLFKCSCSRERVRTNGGRYDGRCRTRLLLSDTLPTQLEHREERNSAIRLNTGNAPAIRFDDLVLGPQCVDLQSSGGDFTVFRRDQQFSYQLATAVDDAFQGVTHVVRGDDLLDSTPRQIFLITALNITAETPLYAHIPVVVDADGQKLSKQNKTPALDPGTPTANLYRALQWLQQNPPPELCGTAPKELLGWAVEHWRREHLAISAN